MEHVLLVCSSVVLYHDTGEDWIVVSWLPENSVHRFWCLYGASTKLPMYLNPLVSLI